MKKRYIAGTIALLLALIVYIERGWRPYAEH